MARSVLVLLAAVGCAQDYGFSTVAPQAVTPGGGAADPTSQVSRPATQEWSAAAVRPTPRPQRPRHAVEPPKVQQVALGGGARSDTVDFLFVIDDSSSMKEIVQQVFDGIDALTAEGVFPSNARIGVMSTLPANEKIPSRPHPAVPQKPFLRLEPGFGDLVDGDRIARFRAAAPDEIADRFQLDGCEAWFAPDAKNDAGVSCLVAHTQELLFPVNVEAGLTALGQRLAKGPLFRTGAAANVIFVSDTHDPGIAPKNPWFDLLVSERPSGEQLAVTAARQQVTSSFRLHAIAPASQCTNEDWEAIGPAYYEAAASTGGKVLDVCTATPDQYVALIRDIVTEGSVPTAPVVPLAEQAPVGRVLVDGVPTPFHLSRDRQAVILDAPMPSKTAQVRIQYRALRPSAGTAAARTERPVVSR